MNNVKKIKRDFMYYKMPEVWVLGEGIRPDYYSKFGDEREDFENFVKKCTLQEFIELMILSYKETYPNFSKFVNTIGKDYNDIEDVFHSEGIYNKHVQTIKWFSEDIVQYDKFKGRDVESYYISRIDIEFKTAQNLIELNKAISNALKSKGFSYLDGKYVVEDSPINEIEITATSFSIIVNKEKLVYYGMVH